MKKFIATIFCIIIILGGCGYGTDVESQAYVVAVGIDKGESFPIKATFVFANPGGASGGGEEKSPSTPKPDVVTVEAPTVFSAVRKLDSIKSKKINMTHVKIVVFADKVAEEGIQNYLSGFASSRDFRPNTYVCVSNGDAGKYLKSVKPSQETFIEKYFDNIMHKVAADKVNEAYLYYLYFNTAENFSGSLVPLVGVNKKEDEKQVPKPDIVSVKDDFSYEIHAGEMLKDSENPAEILGSAMFRNDKMVGILGSFHTDLARIICNEYYPRNYSIAYPGGSNFITVRLIQQKSPEIESSIENSVAKISIKVPVSIEFVDGGKIETNKKESAIFCKYLEDRLNNEAKKFIVVARDDYNADILGLGNSLKKHFPDNESWEKWNWEEKFSSSQITVSFIVEYADFEEAN